jgi:NagD protein
MDATAILQRIRHVVLDLDGTVYLSGQLFPWTQPFLATLRDLQIGYTFLTNNCSRSRRDYVEILRAKGLGAHVHNVHTSGQATIDYLRLHMPAVKILSLVGTDRFATELAEAGYTICDPATDQDPDAVLVAFDTSLNYTSLCKAAYWIQQGKPYVATHPDFVCPTSQPTVLIDCGAVCVCIAAATGRSPDIVIGKPHARMLEGLFRREGLQPAEVAVAGDRLYTDLQMAVNAQAVGVLVLSGETTAEQAAQSDVHPDFIVDNLGEFGELLRQSHGRSHKPREGQRPQDSSKPACCRNH